MVIYYWDASWDVWDILNFNSPHPCKLKNAKIIPILRIKLIFIFAKHENVLELSFYFYSNVYMSHYPTSNNIIFFGKSQLSDLSFCDILHTIFVAKILFFWPMTFIPFWRAFFRVIEVCFPWLHDFKTGITYYSWMVWSHENTCCC